MDPVTLDAQYQNAKLIENYDSFIWAERYNTVGDFQMVAPDVSRFMNLMPIGSRVGLLDSDVVMEVETHQIDRKKNSPEKLIVKGRAMESILDRRVSLKSLTDKEDWKVNVKTPSDLAYFIMFQICKEGILDPRDVFPSVTLDPPDDYLSSSGPVKEFIVPKGNLLSTVLQLLQTESPADFGTTPVTPAVYPRGLSARRNRQSNYDLTLEIYQGQDRTGTVYFDASRDLLDDGTYLFSEVGYATNAYIVGSKSSAKLNKLTVDPSGFNRRVILVDATQSTIEDEEVLRQRGTMALSDARRTAMFDGTVNQDIRQYTYGIDYILGDTVRLVGDYGLEERARVTEFIRSDDATGLKEYPTLETIQS